MLKIFLSILFTLNLVNANDLMLNFLEKNTPKEAKIDLISKTKLKDDLYLNNIIISVNNQKQNVELFTYDNLLFSDIIDLSTEKSIKTNINQFIDYNNSYEEKDINNNIKKFIKTKVPNDVSIEIINKEKINKYITLNLIRLSLNEQIQEIEFFTYKNFTFSEIINLSTGLSLNESMKQEKINKQLFPILLNENQDRIIRLKSDVITSKTYVIFSDPFCPHCRNKFKDIHNILKTHNINILMLPIFGQYSKNAIISFYKDIKKTTTQKEKIDLLNKYFNNDVKDTSNKYTDKEYQELKIYSDKYFQIGIKSVPYITEIIE